MVEWAVAVAALVYLVWRLATYDDYASLTETLQGMGWPQWTALIVCVLLMPVNMALEAWRWKTLMNGDAALNGANDANDGTMSFQEAQRQVYYSKLAGLITPWKLGEYPARALLMEQERRESRDVVASAEYGCGGKCDDDDGDCDCRCGGVGFQPDGTQLPGR